MNKIIKKPEDDGNEHEDACDTTSSKDILNTSDENQNKEQKIPSEKNENQEKKEKKAVKKASDEKKRGWKSFLWYFITILAIISIISTFFSIHNDHTTISYTEFSKLVEGNQVQFVEIYPKINRITITPLSGDMLQTYYIGDSRVMDMLERQNITIKVKSVSKNQLWGNIFQMLFPFLIIGAGLFFIIKQAQGASGQALSFGKIKVERFKKEKKDLKMFTDVAGADEVIEELKEVVDFLKNKTKYHEIGAKIPSGILLMGSPGTGKTLLAKAIAGESQVAFFSLSGSDFVEMFVGVGASRVRNLFEKAKKEDGCIIFIDEIDAVGRHRGAGYGGGHDEREQTLNQLLVEMDGFSSKNSTIVIAATNRPDILDPALLRPGRFDRQITVERPNASGRKDILKIHAKGKKIEENIDFNTISKMTPGFTGADLHNLMNEAALLSARQDKKKISMEYIEESIDRIYGGLQRKNSLLSKQEREVVSYHEMGTCSCHIFLFSRQSCT